MLGTFPGVQGVLAHYDYKRAYHIFNLPDAEDEYSPVPLIQLSRLLSSKQNSLVEGQNITIDYSDPLNPIISCTATSSDDSELVEQVTELDSSVNELKYNLEVIQQFFLDVTVLEIPFRGELKPSAEVWVVDTNSPVPSLSANVVDSSTGTYTGTYVTVGVIDVSPVGHWSLDSTTNLLKSTTNNHYLAYSRIVNSWVLMTAQNSHLEFGSPAISEYVSLSQQGSLPSSYGNFDVSIDLSQLDTSILAEAEPGLIVDSNNKKLTILFGDVPQSGLVYYKYA